MEKFKGYVICSVTYGGWGNTNPGNPIAVFANREDAEGYARERGLDIFSSYCPYGIFPIPVYEGEYNVYK